MTPQDRLLRLCLRGALLASLLPASNLYSQSEQAKPPAPQPTGILFAASPIPVEIPRDSEQALPSIEPVARVVDGKILGCPTVKNEISPRFLKQLAAIYAKGHTYSIWSGGAPLGTAESVVSCIDLDTTDLEGCVHYQIPDPKIAKDQDFGATVWTGAAPIPTRESIRIKATPDERRVFLSEAVKAYRAKGIPAHAEQIHLKTVWHTRLQGSIDALIGSALLQYPAKEPRTYHSDWLFLAVNRSDQSYVPVLTNLCISTAYLDDHDPLPKAGEDVDEGSRADDELFYDNFPLFPDEQDVVISRHTYYEDWGYSIYRWVKGQYHRVYTGCGGGV